MGIVIPYYLTFSSSTSELGKHEQAWQTMPTICLGLGFTLLISVHPVHTTGAGSAAESEARYCGWAKTHIRNDVDCSAWMRNPLPDGGCNMSECQGLADCAEVCTACSVCQGIYFYLGLGNVDDASYSQSPARCYFQGDTLNNINMAVEGYPSVATASSPWAVYVNSRDARCGPERFLRGVSFFQAWYLRGILFALCGFWVSFVEVGNKANRVPLL